MFDRLDLPSFSDEGVDQTIRIQAEGLKKQFWGIIEAEARNLRQEIA